MLRGPLFLHSTFNFIFLFPASSINAPETTLVCVQAVKRDRAVLLLPLLFNYFPAFVSDERLIAIICFNASCCCSISFHVRISKGAQIELFVFSSLTTFSRYSLLLVGIKQRLHFYIGHVGGSFIRVAICVVLYYTWIFSENTQRAGHVRVLLVCHLPFLIEGCPMRCLCSIL